MPAPSLRRLLSVDYTASAGLLLAVAAWVFYVGLLLLAPGPSGAWASPLAPIVLSLLGLALSAWRVALIRSLFARGLAVSGVVRSITHARGGRVRVRFAYTHAGQPRAGGHTLSSSRAPVHLQPDQPITLLIDPHRPARAILRDPFL